MLNILQMLLMRLFFSSSSNLHHHNLCSISLNIAIRKYRYEQYSQKLILKIQIKNRTAPCVHIAPETLLQRFRQKDIDEQLKKEKSKDGDVISGDIKFY